MIVIMKMFRPSNTINMYYLDKYIFYHRLVQEKTNKMLRTKFLEEKKIL